MATNILEDPPTALDPGAFWQPAPPRPPLAMSPNVDDLTAALAEAQKMIVSPQRNREVRVTTKTGGSYTFKYATLDAIIEAVRVPLADNGLWFVQTLAADDGGKYRLTTTLLHNSGQWISSETPLLVQDAGPQAFGSALTYMRRYALTAMLGVAADEDDDGNAGEGNSVEVKTAKRGTAKRGTAKPPVQAPASKPPAEPQRLPVATMGDGVTVDWPKWRIRYEKAINYAPTLEWLNAFIKMNAPARGEYAQSHPRQDNLLIKLIDAKRSAFAQAPADGIKV